MKKKLLVLPLALLLFVPQTNVKANEFEGNEDKYYKLCTSSNLSTNNQEKCQKFTEYLAKQNDDIQADLSKSQDNLSKTKDKLDKVKDTLNKLDKKIQKSNEQLSYLDKSIKKYQKEIKEKEAELKQKIYTMQSFYNSDSYYTYIWKSKNIVDFFSRLGSITDIAGYENDLVQEIKDAQAMIQKQYEAQKKIQEQLKKDKDASLALQKQYVELLQQQQQEIDKKKKKSEQITSAQATINAQLTALTSGDTSSVSGSVVKGDSETGNKIAEAAMSQLGKRYYWGASGPTYYDCSGLVYWAMNKAGVHIGRTTSGGYSTMGQGVSRENLQAGDVITFSYGGGVAHIGIYIGGDKFVNALGPGSSIRGQYPQYCVKVCNLSGYWTNYVYNYRRLY